MRAGQLGVEIDGPPSLFPPAEPAAASRICTASRHLHRHYRMRRKRRAARRRPPSGGPQFNVKTLGAAVYWISLSPLGYERRQKFVKAGTKDCIDDEPRPFSMSRGNKY